MLLDPPVPIRSRCRRSQRAAPGLGTIALALTALLAACDSFAPPAPSALPAPPAMPWIRGLGAATSTDTQTIAASQRMARLAAVSPEDPGGAIELRADATGDGIPETLLASYGGGVLVFDRDGRLLARAPGYEAEGSADDLVALAVGDLSIGPPGLLVATQSGGHHTSVVTIAIYRLARGGLRPMFSAPIELHDGDATKTGELLFVHDGLWYRAPGTAQQVYWSLDRTRGRYVERPTGASPAQDHAPRIGAGPST